MARKLPRAARFTAPTMARKITAVWERATAEEIADGWDWYRSARTVGVSLFGDAEIGAGVIAALSPLTPWARNVQLAAMAADGVDPLTLPTLKTARKAVKRILDGEHWTAVLKGQKVHAFAAAIVANGDTSEVCVDRHARDIAYGVPFGGTGHKRTESSSVGVREYREIAAAYQLAAARLGVPAAVLQAVTWTVHRGTAA